MTSFNPFFDFWKLIRYVLWLIFLIIVLIVSTCNSYGQVTFTDSELKVLARHNLERKECLEIQEVMKDQIDTLESKVILLESEIDLKDSINSNLSKVIANYDKIEQIRMDQTKLLIKDNEEKQDTITSQHRKLSFWRIFTPIVVSATAILGLIF
jgi:hypothetical protein